MPTITHPLEDPALYLLTLETKSLNTRLQARPTVLPNSVNKVLLEQSQSTLYMWQVAAARAELDHVTDTVEPMIPEDFLSGT